MAKDRPPVAGYDPKTHERVRIRRRAHWRIQRFGPDRSLTRKVRIKPYYVMVWQRRNENYELPLDVPEDDVGDE